MNEDYHRIKRLPPYVFAEVNRLKAQARARGEIPRQFDEFDRFYNQTGLFKNFTRDPVNERFA